MDILKKVKKEYEYILFDLDGTITDPAIGITNSVIHALKKFDIEVANRSELYPFIGPPLSYSFQKFWGLTEEQSREAIGYYREYYAPKGIFECNLYDGIADVFAELKTQGRKVVMATSKPEEFAIKLLKHFDLFKYFDCVAGATMDERVGTKIEVMQMAMERMEITDISKAIMIGDREYDINAAKHFGMDSIGVTYGYGGIEELSNAGADYIVEKPIKILEYI